MRSSVATLPRRRATAALPLVRRLAPDDLPQLMRLCAELAEEQALPAEAEPRIELLEALFDAPVRTWVWVAEQHGQLAGFIAASAGLAFPQQRYHLSIDALHVSAPWREDGIADALLTFARARAVELDCVQLRGPQQAVSELSATGPRAPLVRLAQTHARQN
jgi:GNAT superfamily N-acetyltransferase